jgi:hypothetical protein
MHLNIIMVLLIEAWEKSSHRIVLAILTKLFESIHRRNRIAILE